MLCPSGSRHTPVIVGMMFRAEFWRAVVTTAGSKSLSVERLHLCPRRRAKGHMDWRLDRQSFNHKKLHILTTETDTARLCRPPRKFCRSLHPERGQRALTRRPPPGRSVLSAGTGPEVCGACSNDQHSAEQEDRAEPFSNPALQPAFKAIVSGSRTSLIPRRIFKDRSPPSEREPWLHSAREAEHRSSR